MAVRPHVPFDGQCIERSLGMPPSVGNDCDPAALMFLAARTVVRTRQSPFRRI